MNSAEKLREETLRTVYKSLMRPERQHNNFDKKRFPDAREEDISLDKLYPYFDFFLKNYKELFEAQELLEDKASKDIFYHLLMYRMLGHQKVKLSRNNNAYNKALTTLDDTKFKPSALNIKTQVGEIRDYDIEFEGKKIKLSVPETAILYTFLLKQYFLERDGIVIKPEKGDYIIDAGVCMGDTSLAFSAVTGEKGKVFGFEFVKTNLEVANGNFDKNPELKNNIVLVPKALGDKVNTPQQTVAVETGNIVTQGASLMHNTGLISHIPMETIDNYIYSNNITKLDFIKMDIEGYELNALKGGEKAIKQFKPKLAISLYHRYEDFYEIPQYIKSLDVGYKLYLDHYTIHAEETVLYAIWQRKY